MKRILTAIIALFAAVNCVYAESCSTANATQSKYIASGCSYTTQTRKCCSTTSQWSDWTTGTPSCPTCTSTQCWNGSSCVNKGSVSRNCSGNITYATGGTQTRTALCVNGSGWSYGSWSGTCTCDSYHSWNSTTEQCDCGAKERQKLMYMNALNGIWDESTCKGICCGSPYIPTFCSNGPCCKNGNRFGTASACETMS